jgi:hypothetical protein
LLDQPNGRWTQMMLLRSSRKTGHRAARILIGLS